MASGSVRKLAAAGVGLTLVAIAGGCGDDTASGMMSPTAADGMDDAGGPADGGDSDAAHTGDDPGPDDHSSNETGIFAQPAFEPRGEPIETSEGEWTWVPFENARCRDDSTAGIGVNMGSDSSVMIFLEGGGACFDTGTCAVNPAVVTRQAPNATGVFDREHPDNPVADWNYIYVPYCTGDVHIGAEPNGQIMGVEGTQKFVGRINLEKFLHRLVPTFADADEVLLTGVSAGGLGAASNAAFVQWAFGDVPVTVIDDSGPIFSEEYLPPCLNDLYRTTWNLEESALGDCGEACSLDGDWAVQVFEYAAEHMEMRNDARSGVISHRRDRTIRLFYGVGTNNGTDDCMGRFGVATMDEQRFVDGLMDMRERIESFDGFSTYYIPGTSHTILSGSGFYSTRVGGVRLVDWFQGVLGDAEDAHVGGF